MPYTLATMRKALLISVVLALILIPILSSRGKTGNRSLKKTALLILLFNLFFLVVLRFVYWYVQ